MSDYMEGQRREAEWLRGLKVGDPVAFSSAHWGTPLISKVDRILPSGRLVVGQVTFDACGIERTSSRVRRRLIEPTPAVREEIELTKLRGRMAATHWRDLSIDVLRRLAEVLDAAAS